MKGNHPKRRRDKYNPYWICEKDGSYYISFKDGQNVTHEFEIPRYLYEVFDYFELEDLRYLNEWERHYEREKVWEPKLNARAVHKPESLEDTVFRKIQIEKLHKAIQMLSETQLRRMRLHYFDNLSYAEIARREKCSAKAVEYSVHNALQRLENILKKL